MKYRIITPDEYLTVPWKNGMGTTEELIVKYSPDHDNFIWRISIAGVISDGPFSDFSGYDRTLLMLEGNGIGLNHSNGKRIELRKPTDIAEFSGDVKTTAILVNGMIKDFNVMALREKCTALVEIVSGIEEIENDFNELLIYNHTADSTIEIGNSQLKLSQMNLMHIIRKGFEKIKLSSNEAIVVKITYKYEKGRNNEKISNILFA
ncbi:MAG: HutD family protein [Candidatus Delongbacteria bacterium]|jgi:environmental stress-induced protein Ves|nr:HutD family protein [Candidatus Delongbacteria bacterium]